MIQHYVWQNMQKKRFYNVTIGRDTSDNVVIDANWGGYFNKRGGNKIIFIKNNEDISKYINKMMKRRKSRGYELIFSG